MLLFFVKMFVFIIIDTMAGVIIMTVMFQKLNIVSIIKKGVKRMTGEEIWVLSSMYGFVLMLFLIWIYMRWQK